MEKKVNPRYADLLNLPHPTSATHPRMPAGARAAQFSPFAALTGYDAQIREATRTTDRRIELDEQALAVLNRRLQLLQANLAEQPEVTVTWFVPDSRKEGGRYRTVSGRLHRLAQQPPRLILESGEIVPVANLLSVDSPLFRGFEEF